jgi:hypothetical protein
VRDATFYLIAHQVWSSFLSYILTRLSLTDGNGGDQPDPSEILEEWERGAVLDWGKYLAPGVPNEDILRTLQERYRDLQRLQTLMVRQPPNIIQERLQTFLGFEGLAKELVTGES